MERDCTGSYGHNSEVGTRAVFGFFCFCCFGTLIVLAAPLSPPSPLYRISTSQPVARHANYAVVLWRRIEGRYSASYFLRGCDALVVGGGASYNKLGTRKTAAEQRLYRPSNTESAGLKLHGPEDTF